MAANVVLSISALIDEAATSDYTGNLNDILNDGRTITTDDYGAYTVDFDSTTTAKDVYPPHLTGDVDFLIIFFYDAGSSPQEFTAVGSSTNTWECATIGAFRDTALTLANKSGAPAQARVMWWVPN